MNIVDQISNEYFEDKYLYRHDVKNFISEVESEIYRFNSTDKLNFITKLRNLIQNEFDDHYKKCTNKSECSELKDHAKTVFYLDNFCQDFGIPNKTENIFTEVEKHEHNEKLDKIIADLEYLKNGQELTYNDLLEEIEELKKMYFLGKKNWKQLLAGKTVEMITGGIVSETISKELISLSNVATQNLL
jgi:hypothetical protein